MTKVGVVQVAPDSTGKKIHNLEMTILQVDGTLATVEVQVVSLSDSDGNMIDFRKLEDLLHQLLDTNKQMLKAMRGGL